MKVEVGELGMKVPDPNLIDGLQQLAGKLNVTINQRARRIPELCFQMEGTQSFTAVRTLLQSSATALNGSYFLFGMRSGKNISPPVQIAITNYPKRWQRYYDNVNAITFDPVIVRAFQFDGSFQWEDLYRTKEQLELRQECLRHGMRYGVSCSDRGREGTVAIVCICGEKPIVPALADWKPIAASLSLLVTVTQKAVTRILETRLGHNKGYGLSDSELHALQLAASAMTAKEAARILGVTSRTVCYYLDRAAMKLGVASRKEAILKAVAEGVVDNRHFPESAFGPGIERA